MVSAFSDSLMAFGGGNNSPKTSGTLIGMTMKVLPNVGIYQETQNLV